MVRTCVFMVLLSASALLVLGCASTTARYPLGKIRESFEVTKQYRAYEINPGYNYFYAGVQLQPDAIMGIDKRYRIVSTFWHQVELTRDQLEYWVVWGDRQNTLEGFSRRYMGRYMGSYIVDPSGTVIGDWYSKKDWGIFEFRGDNVVVPHPPRNLPGSEYYERF